MEKVLFDIIIETALKTIWHGTKSIVLKARCFNLNNFTPILQNVQIFLKFFNLDPLQYVVSYPTYILNNYCIISLKANSNFLHAQVLHLQYRVNFIYLKLMYYLVYRTNCKFYIFLYCGTGGTRFSCPIFRCVR